MKTICKCQPFFFSFPFLALSFFSIYTYSCAQEKPELNDALKNEVITIVADYMRQYYYDEDIGKNMAAYILDKNSKDNYDNFTDVNDFCKKLTSDLRDVCHDRHIFVFYSPEEAKEVAARNNLLPPDEIAQINKKTYEKARLRNFGFVKLEILDGNVGYIDLREFYNPSHAGSKAVHVMNFLSHTDAIIFDLRNNGGGSEKMVQLLSSYFFADDRVPLSSSYYRHNNEAVQSWTLPFVPGNKLTDVPVYILTSKRTFSAAEEFAYNMKHLKRATIVGERTKGGAHPVEVKIVKGNILTQISIGESFHPVTGTNWEAVGVQPHIEVSEKEAFGSAYLSALRHLRNTTTDPERKKGLSVVINNLE